MGGKFSQGKHYESQRFGIFTEEIFRVRWGVTNHVSREFKESFPPLEVTSSITETKR